MQTGTAKIVQSNGGQRKTFGPYTVLIDTDIDGITPITQHECIELACKAAKAEGADSGYGDFHVYNSEGKELEDLFEHVII